jgi:hypothetical protein
LRARIHVITNVYAQVARCGGRRFSDVDRFVDRVAR